MTSGKIDIETPLKILSWHSTGIAPQKNLQKLQKSPKITHQGSNRVAKPKKSYKQKPVTH
jgi:hypothetical protein